MKLIEAFIIAQQQYGIYGDWKAIHSSGGYIGRVNDMYFAYADIKEDWISQSAQSERLETVLADFAERHPDKVMDEQWKVSRWITEKTNTSVSFIANSSDPTHQAAEAKYKAQLPPGINIRGNQ